MLTQKRDFKKGKRKSRNSVKTKFVRNHPLALKKIQTNPNVVNLNSTYSLRKVYTYKIYESIILSLPF